MTLPHFPHSEMTPNENLHFAMGLMAYAMAYTDGTVQPEEREKFKKIVESELRNHHESFNITDIVFKVMELRHQDRETTYTMAMHTLKVNSHYLSPTLKSCFLRLILKIAEAYPPVTTEEKALYDRFQKDIEPLHGDPVYYGS